MQPSTAPTRSTPAKVLVAYFSRPGENYNNGGRIWRRGLAAQNGKVVSVVCSRHTRAQSAGPSHDLGFVRRQGVEPRTR